MAQYFVLTLDTTAPAGVSFLIDGGNTYSSTDTVELTISTSDSDTTGYQMKIWGDVDEASDTNIKATEETSSWASFVTTKAIKLSAGDGRKTLYVKVRDDVYNASDSVNKSITLNTSIPTVEISGIDRTRLSKNEGANVMSFSFTVTDDTDAVFTEYKVMVVSDPSSVHSVGKLIGTEYGSTNMSGTGEFPMNEPINCTITGADLEVASSGDGTKTIKVFVKDIAGNWSV